MSENRISARPLFLFASAFFLTGIISVDLSLTALSTVSILSAIVMILLFLKARKSHKQSCTYLKPALIAMFGILFASVLILFSVNAEKRSASVVRSAEEECEMMITSVIGTTPNFGSYYAKITSEGKNKGLNVALTAQEGSLTSGDRIKCYAVFEEVDADDRARLAAQKIFLICTAENITFIDSNKSFSFTDLFAKMNSRLSARFTVNGGTPLSLAVLLGNKDELSLDVRRDFSRLGIAHLLAVSGLHLSLVVVLADKLMEKSHLSRRKRSIIKFPIILMYMGITGFSSSVMRAGIMHIIKTTADVVDRKDDGLTSLGLSAILICTVDPYSFYDIGLILSVLSSYGCISFGFMKENRDVGVTDTKWIWKILIKCRSTAMLTLWICALTLPVAVRFFGNISLISPLTNVTYIPLVTFLLYCSLFHMVFCKVPLISAVSGFFLSGTEKLICGTASKISHMPNITVSVKGIVIFILSIVLFICIASIPLITSSKRKVMKIAGVISVFMIVSVVTVTIILRTLSYDGIYVTKGKSEGFVLRDGNDYVLVDMSDGSKKMAYTMYRCAEDENATEIDALILTHLHGRHIASLNDLCGRMIVRKIFVPEAENESDEDCLNKISELCKEKKIALKIVKRENGNSVTIGDLQINLHDYTKLSRSTHPVITFDFTLDGKRYIYGGGSRSESEEFMTVAPSCDTVFIGNHHPKTKDCTLPGIKSAVISFGEVNDEMKIELKKCGNVIYVPEDGIYRLSQNSK